MTDAAVDRTSILSDSVSRENTVRASSRRGQGEEDAGERERHDPMVSATGRLNAPSAQVMVAERRSAHQDAYGDGPEHLGRGRIGSSGSRGRRDISPAPGSP